MPRTPAGTWSTRSRDTDAAQRADFVAVIATDDLNPPTGATVYALHPRLLDPTTHNLIAAPALLSPLTPDTRARLTTH